MGGRVGYGNSLIPLNYSAVQVSLAFFCGERIIRSWGDALQYLPHVVNQPLRGNPVDVFLKLKWRIKMSDNKTVKFLSVATVDGKIIFTLGNGKTIAFDPNEVPKEVQVQALLHGFKQKIADSIAGLSKGEQYAEAYAELADVTASLIKGDWYRRGGGDGGQLVADLAEAIAGIKKCSIATALAAVQKADADQRKVWMKNKAVAGAMAELRAARLKAAAESEDEVEIDGL